MSSLMEGTKYAIARSYRQQGSHIKAFIVETKNIWKFDPKNPLQDYFLMQKQGNAIVMVAIQVLKVHGDRNVLEKEAADVVNDVDKPSRKKFLRRSYDQVQDKIIERDGNPSSESTTPQKRTDENRQKKKKAKSNKKEADPSLEEIFSFGGSMTNSDDPHTVNVAKEHQKRKEHMEQSSNLMLVPDLTSDKSARNFEKNQQEKRRVPVASTGIDCAENYEESPEMSEILSQEIANEESDGSNSKESQNLYIADQRDIVPHASKDDEQEKNKTQGKQLRDRLQGLNGLEEPPLRNNNNDHLRLIHLEKKVRTLEHDNGQLQLENSSLLRQIERLQVYSDRLETELSELRNQPQETVQVSHAQMTAASTSSDSGCVVLSGDDLDRKEFVLGNEPFTKAQIDRWTKLEERPRYTKFDMKHPVTGETIRMFHVALNINIPYEIWKQIKECDPKTFLRNLTPGMWIIAKFANRCMLLVKTTVNPNPNSPRKFFTPRKRCAAEIAFKDQIDKKIPINKKKPEDSMLERAKMESQFSVIMGDKVSQAQKDLRKLKGKFDDFIMKEIPVDAENPTKSKEKQAKIRDKFNSILEDPVIGQRQISLIKKKGFKKFFSIDLTSEESPSDHLTPQSNASNAPIPHQSTPPSRPSSRRSIPHLDFNDHDGTPRSLENAECNDNRPNLATPSRSGCTSATGAVQRSVFVPRQPIRCHLESLSSKESGTRALGLKHTSLARSKSQQGGRPKARSKSPSVSESPSKFSRQSSVPPKDHSIPRSPSNPSPSFLPRTQSRSKSREGRNSLPSPRGKSRFKSRSNSRFVSKSPPVTPQHVIDQSQGRSKLRSVTKSPPSSQIKKPRSKFRLSSQSPIQAHRGNRSQSRSKSRSPTRSPPQPLSPAENRSNYCPTSRSRSRSPLHRSSQPMNPSNILRSTPGYKTPSYAGQSILVPEKPSPLLLSMNRLKNLRMKDHRAQVDDVSDTSDNDTYYSEKSDSEADL